MKKIAMCLVFLLGLSTAVATFALAKTSQAPTFSVNQVFENIITTKKTSQILSVMGSGQYVPLSDYYENLNDVYHDFNISPKLIMPCDDRHAEALASEQKTWMKTAAENYFCTGSFDNDHCRANQYKKVYLNYCLDLNDALDWVAIQSAILNANKRTVVIPSGREYIVNQTLVLPSNTEILWEGVYKKEGYAWRAEKASFIKYVPFLEPIDSVQLPAKITGFTAGSIIISGDLPFIYSGSNSYPAYKINGNITENIALSYPMIDANGHTFKGENGISFALGTSHVRVHGGTIKNVQISKALAGGKAIQCEAGCQDIKIYGLEIKDSYIGINSNAIQKYQKFNPFLMGPVSDIEVDGLLMLNVELPINVYNNIESTVQMNTQDVYIHNFKIINSGAQTENSQRELYGDVKFRNQNTRLNSGTIKCAGIPAEPVKIIQNGGILTTRGGKNIRISDGEIVNDQSYTSIADIVTGYAENSSIRNIKYRAKLNCAMQNSKARCLFFAQNN